ncbi:MAG: hypothetical protein WA885_15855 [Phormidesmis sp.]
MTKITIGNGNLRRYCTQLFKLAMATVLSVGLAIIPAAGSAIAYSVDYEMDKARGEKTVEHYGEPVRPIVEQAIKNNENNPNSKSTAENSYKRESPLNDLLPERLGQFFSKDDLLEMRNTDDPTSR